MATKMILLAVSGIILLGSTLAFIQGPDQEQHILESTVMITMTVPELEAAPEVDEALPIPADEYRAIVRPDSYVAAEGLGTLVHKDGEPLIITHDHWSALDSQLGIIHIRNGNGQLLVEMQMLQFKGLIKYRDSGTMILSAPEEIATRLRPGNMLSHSLEDPNLTAGDEVSLVYRQRNGEPGVAMMQAEVESIGRKQGLPVLRLSTPEGQPIVGGDSGGGVWLEGQLVANTWMTIMMADTLTGDTRPAGSSIAALIGFGEGLVNSASAIDPAELKSMEQEILSTTLRIVIETWIIYVEGQGYTTLSSNGHGTVMGGRYLLTHNHFRLPLLELLADDLDGEFATVTLYSANGEFLWQGPLTTAGVAYDDSETLLLEFLDKDGRGLFESLGLPSAEFVAGQETPVAAESTVAQINWDQNRAYVQWTKVQAVLDEEGTLVVRLADCLIPGASGGGVFWNGAHIANNWSRSAGCGEASDDEAQRHSTAALNSAELLASI